MRRMNLGCGYELPEGWVNVDVTSEFGASTLWNPAQHHEPYEYVGTMNRRIPFSEWEDSFDLVVANHVLMMVEHHHLETWLWNVRRILRPGGVLRLIQADMLAAFEAWREQRADWFPPLSEESVDGKLCMYLSQASKTKSMFTPGWTIELCLRAGYHEAVEVEFGESTLPAEYEPTVLDSRESESFVVEARR